jgi:hypothetical protein
MPNPRSLTKTLLFISVLALPATGWAQVGETGQETNLHTTRSVVQKTGLGTLAVTGALGVALAVNRPTLFGDGRCATNEGVFGEFGCSAGLSLVHFGFAATSLGLFVAGEILAEKMEVNPYDLGDAERVRTMRALRWTNVGLFAVQPVLGILAAHPGLIGIPPQSRAQFSRILRTIHLGVGLGLATTYSVNAAFQW